MIVFIKKSDGELLSNIEKSLREKKGGSCESYQCIQE